MINFNLRIVAAHLRRIIGEKYFQHIKAFAVKVPLSRYVIKTHLVSATEQDLIVQMALGLVENNNVKYTRFLNSLTLEQLQNKDEIASALIKYSIPQNGRYGGKVIALYLVGPGYIENLGNIPYKLRQKGYRVLVLSGTTPEQTADRFKEALAHIKIDACIYVGLIEGMPQAPINIYFVHDIYDSALTNLEKIQRLLPKCNYIFTPNQPALRRYREQIILGRQHNFSQNNPERVCLIPGGYPKLDNNIRYLQKHFGPLNTIVYATTIMDDIKDLMSIPKYGTKIIKAVLNAVGERYLVFRPHPGTFESSEVNSIVQTFKKHPRFIFDNNPTSYMKYYSKAAFMISDLSGTAYTYAFTTLRPVIFFSHNESEIAKRFHSYKYFVDREKIGYVAQNIDEMVEKIKLLLAQKDEFATRIKEYRDATIYNIGQSEDYFVDNIEYILEGKKHPDWIYI